MGSVLRTRRPACPEILALSETWLDLSVDNNEINYLDSPCIVVIVTVVVVMLLYIVPIICPVLCFPVVLLLLVLSFSEFLSSLAASTLPLLLVACIVHLYSSSAQSVHDVCNNIESVMVSKKHVLACGDFNIDMADLDKPYSQTLQSFITTHSLIQPISHPTRYSGASNSILDLFLVSPDVPISKSLVLESSFSDHLLILLQLNCAVSKPPPTLITRRSFKNFSKSNFEEDLSLVPWSIIDVFDDPDDKVDTYI